MAKKKVKTNNKGTLVLQSNEKGMEIIRKDSKGNVEDNFIINDGELVMLLNYYINCKNGLEESSYIVKGEFLRG